MNAPTQYLACFKINDYMLGVKSVIFAGVLGYISLSYVIATGCTKCGQ